MNYTRLLALIEDIKRIGAECSESERPFVFKMIEDVLKSEMMNGIKEAAAKPEVMPAVRRGRPKKSEVEIAAPKIKRKKRGRRKGSSAAVAGRKVEITGKPSIENVRAFLESAALTDVSVRSLFAIGEESVMRLYNNVGEEKKAKAQLNAVLLNCLAGALISGRFLGNLKQVRSDCKEMGIYDNNFTNNIKRHPELFRFLEKNVVELTDAGKQELVELIKMMNAQSTPSAPSVQPQQA
ncbi:MAG: hypothetical protein RMI34_12240 [Chloroherpetonaceae bacterium]|nr:hypothetical protein [Chloroherpetonaceae bacterium]MCS7212298.1 hypothetical protein [Chloroherpetonaceae bacterium]MDW8020827.1 hypothetical protein [Chloroherpetonaceae bacterium]MDW8466788.1 hypothetical protein [Chloroherpetonaceae bacterium]